MARTFAITTTALDPLPVDARGHAEAVFTVTNTTSRAIRGMGKAKPLGDTKSEWLRIQGDTERDFAPGATQQFTVSFQGPKNQPASATSTGAASAPSVARKYSFRLDVASASNPEEDFTEGPSVTAAMPNAPVITKSKFPWWIIPVAAVVLLAIGITLFLVLRTKKVEVPNVVGKPLVEATNILKEKKLEGTVKENKATGTVPVGSVASQDPEASGAKVPVGSTVALTVEAEPAGPNVLINFADNVVSANWGNDVDQTILLTLTHDGHPEGSVVKQDGQPLENDAAPAHVIETHPRWVVGGKITGTYTLPRALTAGDRFRTQIGFLKGAAPGHPEVRLRLLLNGSVIDEITKGYDGSLRNWTVNLDEYAGQSGKFALQVVGIPTPNWAWICWVNPRIER